MDVKLCSIFLTIDCEDVELVNTITAMAGLITCTHVVCKGGCKFERGRRT